MHLNELVTLAIKEAANVSYVLYINGRESTKYNNMDHARQDRDMLVKKFPLKKFEIKEILCKEVAVENKNDNSNYLSRDPEILNVIKFSRNHYPGSKSDEEALDKFIIHSLKHSKNDDEIQDQQLSDHDKQLKRLSDKIQQLESNIQNLKTQAATEGIKNLNDSSCWKNYKRVGTKKKNGKNVPNCVPVGEEIQQSIHKYIQVLEAKQKSTLRKSVRASLPNTQIWPGLDNNNNPYLAYRFGVAMAGAPTDDMDKYGPIGSEFTTVGFTSADDEITNAAAKIIGVKSSKITSKKSKEMDIVNTKSLVPDRNKLRK